MLFDFASEEQTYNFSRLDSIFDFLLKIGMKPFIELHNKPRRVEKTTSKALVYEEIQEMEDSGRWEELLRAFLRHLTDRYGREEIDTWKFELWFNDADLMDEQKIKAFADRFALTYRVIHEYTEGAEVGGNGMHGFVKQSGRKAAAIIKLYRMLEENPATPDFISIYAYAYDSYMDQGLLLHEPSADPGFVVHAYDNLEKEKKQSRFADIKVYITEWNLSISDRNYINDTCFKGAYIVKNYIDMIGRVDVMAYFCGTDRLSEFYDTSDFLYGGMGLLTKDGIMKPAAFAFDFLNSLYRNLVAKGRNYAVTTDGHGTFGILCHNCKDLNHNYYYVEEDELDVAHMDRYYEDCNSLTLHFVLEDMEDGMYRMKRYRVNEQSGAVLSLWRDMGYEKNLSREDVKYFHRLCEPKLSIQNVAVQNGKAELSLTMLANEITFVRLIREE